MISTKFIDMIKNNSDQIARKWTRGLLIAKYSQTYRKFPEEELFKRGKDVYDNLGKWLNKELGTMEMAKIYVNIGKQRYQEGFPLCEVLYALHYIKKVLWNFILSEGMLSSTLEIYQVMDLMVTIYKFFDSAAFYLTRGYHEAMYIKLTDKEVIEKDKIADIFPPGSFYLKFEKEPNAFEKMMEGFNLFKVK